MSHLLKPVDLYSAKEVMKKFPDMAYSLNLMDIFQKAVDIIYGKDFIIKCDMSNRMQFSCQICNRDMNSENAMADHYRSGNHQKNLDKKVRESGESSHHKMSYYAANSLRHRLLISQVKPLGLQMVEEFDRHRDPIYYKCNLCAAHGKLDVMYHHLIGKKHTERYIKSACVLENSVLTNNEREELRHQLVKIEGINCEAMKTYYGSEFFPKKWEAEGFTSLTRKTDIKKEYDSVSSCLSSPMSSRSRSPSQWPRNKGISPEPKKLKRSPISRSSTPPRSPRRGARSPSLSRFRNRSPPPPPQDCFNTPESLLEPHSTAPPPPPLPDILPSPPALPPPLPPPVQTLYNSSTPIVKLKKETKDQGTQQFDLEELMIHMNFIIKTHDMPESDIKTAEDAKLAIELMLKISEALYSITRTTMDNSMLRSEEKQKALKKQKEFLTRIMGYLKHRMEAHWQKKYGH